MEITPSEVALHGASHGSSTTLPAVHADEDHSNTTTSHSSLERPGTSASSTSAVLPFRAGLITLACIHRLVVKVDVLLSRLTLHVPLPNTTTQVKITFPSNLCIFSKVYEVFVSQASVAAVDEILRLCDGDTGGVTRQFCTDVLRQLAQQGVF